MGVWYGMFVLSASFALAGTLFCPVSGFSVAAAVVGVWCSREYLNMGDEERFF